MTTYSVRAPVTWYGGKSFLARKIVSLFPSHFTYVEPFGGGASVLLNKPPSPIEIYNDVNAEVVSFFVVLRDRADELIRRLTLTPYSEAEFHAAAGPATDSVERARQFLVRHRQSFSGKGKSFSRSSRHRSRHGMADNVSSWMSNVDANLPSIVQRLRRVEFHCRPAIEVIRRYDAPDTLFYCDPPYVHASRERNSRAVYAVEMTDEDHRKLAEVLLGCKGKVILSGYPSRL